MHEFGERFERVILRVTDGSELLSTEVIQELWSGYGKILRVRIGGGSMKSIVVKHVRFPTAANHPRGWNSNLSHERKVKSYEVEINWYSDWSRRCDLACRVPTCLAFDRDGDEVMIALEDLDDAGFAVRLGRVDWSQLVSCLGWLANFHATFMGAKPAGLWEVGTYWHLATRSEELDALEDGELKRAAMALDARLSGARHQTVVHGDAKLANFCFAEEGERVAAVDFQYVGGGCGMKDVAYLMGSCLDEGLCEKMEAQVLDCYFSLLRDALARRQAMIEADAVIAEWRELFPVAWTDFHRFLKGWSPGHWKINGYSERLAREVVRGIGIERDGNKRVEIQ